MKQFYILSKEQLVKTIKQVHENKYAVTKISDFSEYVLTDLI